MTRSVLKTEHMSKSYNGTAALADLDLELIYLEHTHDGPEASEMLVRPIVGRRSRPVQGRKLRHRLVVALPGLAVLGLAVVPAEGAGQSTVPARTFEANLEDASARWTASATRVDERIVLDGRLDEPAWATAQVVRDFRQIEPVQGADPILETEVRILYDDQALYVGVEVRDPAGAAGVRVPEVRRNFGYFDNDLVGIALDGFGDGRTAMAFQVNPHGALRDLRAFDGQFFDREWQGVWEARTSIHTEGWTAELRVPWSTLRYDPGREAWRMILVRRSRRLNEEVGWPEWPRQNNAYTMRYAGRLEGLDPPEPTRNLQLQPYVTARSEGDPTVERLGDTRHGDAGGELKWAATPNTVVDLTVNTDFAEADVDRQVVNLSRFSVFFPEQRPFFLENAGLFRLVDGTSSLSAIEPFFSRRIGLDSDGTPLAIHSGARVTHQTPSRSAGALLVRQEGSGWVEASTIGVARVQRNVGEHHRLGALVATRTDEGIEGGRDWNTVGAVDWFTRPTSTSWFRGMVSASTDGATSEEGWSGFFQVANSASWGYVGWIQRWISSGYRPRAGFIPGGDLITTSPAANLDLRPDWLPSWVRYLEPGVTTHLHHRASDGRLLEGRVALRPLVVVFQDGSRFRISWVGDRQDLGRVFEPLPGLPVEPGSYRYGGWGAGFSSDPSARYSGSVSWNRGGFFDGELEQVGISGRALPSSLVSVGIQYELNRIMEIGRDGRSAKTHLLAPELRVALNPRAQLYTVYQHNTAAGRGTLNARFSWEFAPLSHVHLVVNDGRPVRSDLPVVDALSLPRERQLLLKLSYLWQL